MNLLPFAASVLRGHWKLIVVGMLLALLGVQTLRVASLKSSLRAEQAGRKADRASYETAQAQAAVDAYAAKGKKEAEDAKKADAADARADDLAARYRALSLRYAAAQGRAGKLYLPVPTQAAESPDSPGGNPVIPSGSILIPQADALICADGIARLQAGHEWALGL